MLDDAISLVKGMDFYGKATKPYVNNSNKADPLNGKFCTMPVKMAFKDKGTKQQVEQILRTKCKVQCTTPYPVNLRKAIKAAVETNRAKYAGQFIQARVDAEAGVLRLSRKEGKEGKWVNNFEVIKLSESDMATGRPGFPDEAEQMSVDQQAL